MNKLTLVLTLFIFCFISINKVKSEENNNAKSNYIAYDSTKLVVVSLVDGAKIKGYILSETSEEISLKNILVGTIIFKKINIISIVDYYDTPVNQGDYKYNNKNPNNLNIIRLGSSSNNNTNNQNKNFVSFKSSHKYYINNNYIGLKKSEIVYQNIWLLYNSWDFGLSDNFSIGGGFLFLGPYTTANLHFRTQIELKENLKLGAAYNIIFVPKESNIVSYGITSCGFTIGNQSKNITISIGQGSTSKNASNNSFNNIAYAFSGSYKINESTSLITDNFFMEKSEMKFYSIGFRFHNKKTVFDIGYMGNTYMADEYYYTNGKNTAKKYETNVGYPFIALTYKIK